MKKSDKEFWRELLVEPFVKKHYEVPEEFLLVEIDDHLMITLLKQKMFTHNFPQDAVNSSYKLNLHYPDWLSSQREEGSFKGSFVNLVLNGSYYSMTLQNKNSKFLPMGMPRITREMKISPTFSLPSATVNLVKATFENWQAWSAENGFQNSFRLDGSSFFLEMNGQDYEDSFYAFCLMIQERSKSMKLKSISYQNFEATAAN